MCRREGRGAVLRGQRGPAEAVVEPAGHRAVADTTAGEGLAGEVQRPGDPAGVALVLGVGVHAPQRLMEAEHPPRADVSQEPHHRARLGLRARPGPGLVAPVEVLPAVGEVAVEVDTAGVLAGAGREAVGVVRRHDPQVDAVHPPAVAQAGEDAPGRRLVTVHRRDEHHLGLAALAEVPGRDRPAPHRAAEDALLQDGGPAGPLGGRLPGGLPGGPAVRRGGDGRERGGREGDGGDQDPEAHDPHPATPRAGQTAAVT